MSKSKHTPGPWAVEREIVGGQHGPEMLRIVAKDPHASPESGHMVVPLHLGEIGYAGGQATAEEKLANARLVAATPDLHKAAIQALWHLGTDDDRIATPQQEKWNTSREDAAELLRAAIAKAEGSR